MLNRRHPATTVRAASAPWVVRSLRDWAGLAGLIALFGLAGCAASSLDDGMLPAVNAGRYGGVGAALSQRLTEDRSSRDYVLDRARLLSVALAEGSPDAAEEVANEYFAMLRTQGLNEDRTIRSVVFSDGVRIWKGEPFEQALGYTQIALQKAMRGEWDNARAASQSSLFLLKDFTDNELSGGKGGPSAIQVARRAAQLDQARGQGAGDQYIDNGYAAVKTDYALGYLLTGVASLALARPDEAADNFREAARLEPSLELLAEELLGGGFNTVLVVDFGRGPTKINTGPDGAFTAFQPNARSTPDALSAQVIGPGGVEPAERFAAAIDLNRMSSTLKWNNLDDVRQAKSLLGTGLLVGGAAVAVTSEDDEARWVGAGMVLAGLLLKATATADTRYNEFLPQRTFVVPVTIAEPGSSVAVQLDRDTASRMVLPALDPPAAGVIQLRYVRLPPIGGQAWQQGTMVYANDRFAGPIAGDDLPFILGGRCVKKPSLKVLQHYQASGNLRDYTLIDLENLYREEAISLSVEDQRGGFRKHILEGGDSMVCPLGGTTGFTRLMCQVHRPYQPRSRALIDAIGRLKSEPRNAIDVQPSP